MIKKQCKSFCVVSLLGITVLMLVMLTGCSPASSSSIVFHLKYDSNVSSEPVTGRVYVLLHNNPKRTPMYGPDPLDIQPFYARDVKNWKPGETIIIDENALSWTIKMNQLKGEYAIQAVLDFDTEARSILAPGNGTSQKLIKKIAPHENNVIEITIDQVVKAPEFKETELIKEVNIPSQLLSDFYGRTIRMQAAVVLPPAYHENQEVKYPTVYVIPGWGGTHYHISMGDWNQKRYAMNTLGLDKVFVFLSHECPLGYHCFVDSENNGPRARALVEEFVPYIEKNYRVFTDPSSRFLTGMSSGAWAALWLQVTYPDFFGGAWAVAPDPVDFRANIGGTDIYQPNQNIYYDENGNLRPLGRENGKIIFTIKEFMEMEEVYGDGEQMLSFEATFSKRGPDGRPELLFDRKTGKINPEVAEQWKKYDLRIILENNWERLGPRLAGKLHVYVAKDDTFFMDWSLKRFKESLDKIGSDALIKFLPSGGHGDDLWKQVIAEIHQGMDKGVLSTHPELEVRPLR